MAIINYLSLSFSFADFSSNMAEVTEQIIESIYEVCQLTWHQSSGKNIAYAWRGEGKLIYALLGAIIMFSVLIVIGINQPRKMTMEVWCVLYVFIAIAFDALVIVALMYEYATLIETSLGVSAGAATGLAIHVAHHVLEERQKTKT